jgi:hypothetical protein
LPASDFWPSETEASFVGISSSEAATSFILTRLPSKARETSLRPYWLSFIFFPCSILPLLHFSFLALSSLMQSLQIWKKRCLLPLCCKTLYLYLAYSTLNHSYQVTHMLHGLHTCKVQKMLNWKVEICGACPNLEKVFNGSTLVLR